MRLSKTLVDMDMADYSAALDPAYTTLEFENVQVLAMGNGRWGQVCSGVPVGAGVPRYGSGTLALWGGRRTRENGRLGLQVHTGGAVESGQRPCGRGKAGRVNFQPKQIPGLPSLVLLVPAGSGLGVTEPETPW